jgi:hypothetical protein
LESIFAKLTTDEGVFNRVAEAQGSELMLAPLGEEDIA